MVINLGIGHTYQEILKYRKMTWNWLRLNCNSDITLEIIEKNLDLPWIRD